MLNLLLADRIDPNNPSVNLPTCTSTSVDNCIPNTSFETLFGTGIKVVLITVAVAAFIGIVYSGLMMITSGGDATKFALAKKNLLYAVIGIIVVILAFFIISLAYGFAGSL